MTKKNYEVIALAVNDFKNSSVDNNVAITEGHVENLIDILSAYLVQDNPSFNQDKFKEACLTGKHIRRTIKEGV